MTLRLQNLMLAMLLALTTVFVGFGTLSQKPTSGGYQLFERAASGISADIQLASLGNSAQSLETASEYANAPNTGVPKPGEYLNDFQPSPTPLELVQGAGGQGTKTATIRYDHIMDGNINGRGQGTGGHYIRSDNIRVTEFTSAADANGVRSGRIQVRDPSTGGWVNKPAETSFYPETWTRRQTAHEIEGAFVNSSPVPNPSGGASSQWQGVSPSGVPIRGYYTQPDGGAATAWPVQGGG